MIKKITRVLRSLGRREINLYFAPLNLKDALIMLANACLLTVFPGKMNEVKWADIFKASFKKYIRVKEVALFGSARSALYVLLKTMGISPGDEVIITGFTCVAVPNPIIYLGAKPVYVDIDPLTLNMDVSKIESQISEKTKAIIVQHTLGNPAAIDHFMEIAKARDLFLIEDCCLALGSTYKGAPVGSFGDAAIFSLELSKTITAGWGGVLCLNNQKLAEKITAAGCPEPLITRREAIRRSFQVGLSYFLYHPYFYSLGKYLLPILFKSRVFRHSTQLEEEAAKKPVDFLCRMPDAHWRIANNQLKRIPTITARQRKISGLYTKIVQDKGLTVFNNPDGNWIRFPLVVKDRSKIMAYFARQGISLGNWFDGVISPKTVDNKIYHYQPGSCVKAEALAKRIVNLPVHVRMTNNDIQRVGKLLRAYLKINEE